MLRLCPWISPVSTKPRMKRCEPRFYCRLAERNKWAVFLLLVLQTRYDLTGKKGYTPFHFICSNPSGNPFRSRMNLRAIAHCFMVLQDVV